MEAVQVIVADTHVVIWLAMNRKMLSKDAIRAIEEARKADGLAICDATLYELAWLVVNKRVHLLGSLEEFLGDVSRRFIVLPMTPSAAQRAAEFSSPYPSDPMDRLIGATALDRGVPLVTKDRAIRQSKQVETIW